MLVHETSFDDPPKLIEFRLRPTTSQPRSIPVQPRRPPNHVQSAAVFRLGRYACELEADYVVVVPSANATVLSSNCEARSSRVARRASRVARRASAHVAHWPHHCFACPVERDTAARQEGW